MPLFAGIDGGGTKTLAVVVDETGQVVGQGRAANANYQVLMTQGLSPTDAAALVARRIVEAINHALPDKSLAPVAIYGGLAGVDRPVDATRIRTALAGIANCPAECCEIVNDAELILYGLADAQGTRLGLVAGTGSIAVGQNSAGRKARAGGWGYVFGDEGSGYAIGLSALQAAAHAADKRGPATVLLPDILAAWKLTHPDDLIGAVYSSSEDRNQKIAQLAPLVFTAARNGDTLAQGLVKQAAYELAAAVWAVYTQLGYDRGGHAPVLGLGGSLLLNTPELKIIISERLAPLAITPERVINVPDPAKAAALACLRAYEQQTVPQNL